MRGLVEKLVGQGSATRQDARKETGRTGKAKARAFVFAFKPPTKTFDLRLRFRKSRVDRHEIIEALENILKELRSSR
jgi:hypothetical protein